MRIFSRFVFRCAITGLTVGLITTPALAADGQWRFRLEGVFTDVSGNDQHVLTVHDITSAADTTFSTAGHLDTDSGFGYRTEMQYQRGDWGMGLDFVWFKTNQSGPDQSASGTPGSLLVYEVADRTATSTGPSEILYYRVLEDTALAMWTLDLYGFRRLVDDEHYRLDLLFGLRNADFDNDYRAMMGVRDVGGTRMDASSNYDRMIGPMLGLSAEVDFGRNRLSGAIVQAVHIGSVELTGHTRDFSGPADPYAVEFGAEPPFETHEQIWTTMDVTIPVTELRLGWAYRLSERFSAGLGINTSTWWDVPVPPGTIPKAEGNIELSENTLVFFGLSAAFEMRF